MQIAVIKFSDHSNPKLHKLLADLHIQATEVIWSQVDSTHADYQGYILLGDALLPELSVAVQNETALNFLMQQNQLGKPILAQGFSAKLLVEHGFLPGVESNKPVIKMPYLTELHEKKVLQLAEDFQLNAFTQSVAANEYFTVTGEQYDFVIPVGLLYEMRINGLAILEYQNSNGQIAAVSNKSGNMLALGANLVFDQTGVRLLQAMQVYIKSGFKPLVAPLFYYPRA
jgi:hypothetical protein